MKILKKICALVLTGCLFLYGSGFSNKYEDVQTIELKSNPSTAYSWNFEVLEGLVDPVGEVEISHTFQSNSNDKHLCGAGGTDIFKIKGVKEGKIAIVFEYSRACETDDIDLILLKLHVNKLGQVKILKYENL